MKTIKTMNEDPVSKFYSEYFMFSYSSLNKLMHSPRLFYNWYVLRDRKDNLESHMVGGKVIHCLLLDRNMYDEQFIVMPGELPGISNKKIVEAMYRLWKENEKIGDLGSYEEEILKWLEVNNLHQKLADDKDLKKPDAKTAKQKRLSKVITAKSRNYFEYMKVSQNKDVIDQDTHDKCDNAVEIIKENKVVTDLLKTGHESFELLEVFNENMLACKLQNFPFGLRGIVDNYVIDHTDKKVYVNDLKTSGKSLKEFHNSVEYYMYWLQAAIYIRLVKANHPDTKDYEFIFHFVVIDNHNQVYPFPVSKESMLDWQSQLDGILEKAKYHYTNKDYTLPYEFALGQVTL